MALEVGSFIAARRDGGQHTREELMKFAHAAADGSIPDYQISAWLMAAFFRPLNLQETAWLTEALAHSGEIMDLEGLPHPWVDKHSTGGVGDKTTLVLLPLLAACGLTLVKMSGRGLGVTGGTIDKLASIPGFRTDLNPREMKEQAKRIGLALTGQTPNLAPADKVLYALRDTTGTVGSIPLIVSSVLSKKIAGGAEVIVLDVKCGSGGLITTEPEARQLATMLADVGKNLGLKLRIALTDMEQPLGSALGNSLEVMEAVKVLRGDELTPEEQRFRRHCLEMAELTLSALPGGPIAGNAEERLADGSAHTKFNEWCLAQGASVDVTDRAFRFEAAPCVKRYEARRAGFVSRIDAQTFGRQVMRLGGGRKRKEDSIDLRVGIQLHAHVGSQIPKGDPLFTVHATDEETADKVASRAMEGVTISPDPVAERPLVLETF